MIRRNETKVQQARQRNESKRWRTYTLIFVCTLLLASGFFFAGRQHFSSMDYGMKNSRLRRQVDELEAEKRRLILAKEISLSPGEIKKAAKKAGMMDPVVNQTEIAVMIPVTKEKSIPASAPAAKPIVVKTVAVTPATPTVAATYVNPEKIVKQLKKALTAE